MENVAAGIVIGFIIHQVIKTIFWLARNKKK